MLIYGLGDEQLACWWPQLRYVVLPHGHDDYHHKSRLGEPQLPGNVTGKVNVEHGFILAYVLIAVLANTWRQAHSTSHA
jgi:hypothetical protein